jgi:5-methylcytosine-specific restriction endonuclease McrA
MFVRSDAVSRWRRRVKLRWIEEAGGACRLCGYSRYQGALQFHHIDPTQKEFVISRHGVTRSFAEARREAAKCVLLCANCHAEVEGGVAELPVK